MSRLKTFAVPYLLFLLQLSGAPVASAGEQAPKFEEFLGRATNLALQHDRVQATQILRNALVMAENSNNNQLKKEWTEKLRKALDSISTMFFEDKTQQLYELARSLEFQDRKLALGRLDEALRSEADNLTLLVMRANLLLSTGDCEKAEQDAQAALAVNPQSSVVQLSLAQSYFCEANTEKLFSYLASLGEKKTNSIYWHTLKVRSLISIGALEKAQLILESDLKEDKNYPEPYFLLFSLLQAQARTGAKGKSSSIEEKYKPDQTYLNLCQNLSLRAKRLYSQDPWLCQESQFEVIRKAKEALPKSEEE